MSLVTVLPALLGLLFAGPSLAPPSQPSPHALGEVADASFLDPETLIRLVVKAQGLAEKRLSGYTFDQREVETTYAKDGRPKETHRRLFYVLTGDDESGGSRELVEVDGRPATADERKDALEKDEKGRKQRLERQAASRSQAGGLRPSDGAVQGPPPVSGAEEDPLVGTRRLSDLINRYDYEVVGEAVVDGRPTYVIDFTPKKNLVARGIGDRALNALAGRALIDAADFQVRAVNARITSPLKVAGGLAANIGEAIVSYTAEPILSEHWFPCVIDLRLRGKTALFFRLDTAYRFEFAGFQRFEVAADATVREAPVEPPPVP